jgi:putative ABC transport system ATP-binding protein
MVILEARQVCKCFRQASRAEVRALHEVSLTIDSGSFTVLTGPSGSGKTTLLALLGALERPTSGQIFFQGEDFGRLSDVALARARRRMGFIFQDFSLLPNLPVWENITYPLIPRGIPRRRRFELAQALLQRFGLLDKLLSRSQDLSGGEMQRVAVARALAGEPQVLLADEPTSNLDPEAARTLLDLLREINRQGTTIILSTHDPSAIVSATQVHRLERGKLVV